MIRHLGVAGGRGLAVVVWSLICGTVVIFLVFALILFGRVGDSVLGNALVAYFGMIAAVGGVYQGKNIAEGFRSGNPNNRATNLGQGTPSPEDK